MLASSITYDAVIVGSGPNGLAAAAHLVQAGLRVHVVEAAETLGGGLRTAELTLPGFQHDVCAAIHPMGELSPFFQELQLETRGLEFRHPEASVAHPLEDGPAILLQKSLTDTAAQLGKDQQAYDKLLRPFLRGDTQKLMADILGPARIPKRPFTMARFGYYGLRPATRLAHGLFKEHYAKALFAGCAAHSVISFDKWLSGGVGLIFCYTGHLTNWPLIVGGSANLAKALCSVITAGGGTFETKRSITHLAQLPPARAYLFDVAPRQFAAIAKDALPAAYVKRLAKYRYGPGFFKVDYALSQPIPWKDPRCLQASTVHVGGTFEEIAAAEHAAYHGTHAARPFVLVAQQSQFDSSRAPAGQHTGYAYCHVPAGSIEDMTEAIEAQIERFAPGFRDCILARHTFGPAAWEAYNPNYVGGACTGGVADLFQFFTRPVARLSPYSTPNPQLFLCSAATPPGGGVHGMCGYFAARSAFPQETRALRRQPNVAPQAKLGQ